jgi:hypothetical protein
MEPEGSLLCLQGPILSQINPVYVLTFKIGTLLTNMTREIM